MGNDQFIDTFKEEALELLGTLESTLLELENEPEDKELVSAVFRVMHTIKGSAAMFSLDQIAAFSHEVESILSALREGKLKISRELIDYTLQARDRILGMLEDTANQTGVLQDEAMEFLFEFKTAVGFTPEADIQSQQEEKAASQTRIAVKKTLETWHIKFKPGKDIFRRGTNPFALINEVRNLGETVCIPNFENIVPLRELDPEDCLTSWEMFINTTATENEIRDIFVFVEDFSEISIECLKNIIDENNPSSIKLGEILVGRGKLTKDTLKVFLDSQKRIGEILVEEKLVSPNELKMALEEQKQLQKVQKSKAASTDINTIRVKSEKLDQLMALVGELVTIHARIQQTSKSYADDDELTSIIEHFGRLTDELRSNTMGIRMIPIGTSFSSFKRLVRDLSAELGKNVELVTEGGETELDKTVIEKLNDPLIHIIRNSLDHGIENPGIRTARQKDEAGTIKLSASQTGASVYINIEDDGNGLDTEAIRKKAVEKGIIRPDDVLTRQELYKLIFAPGFSTKEKVSAVSGRGVGMDVVNRQMEMIGGSITIESEEKKYTRIMLKIPLTLAIIEGLLVRIQNDNFVIPLSVIVGCLEYIETNQKNNNNIVMFHGRQLPFVNMRKFFSIPGERSTIEQIVVVSIKNQLIGILVDQVQGSNQTVIKPLGKIYRHAEGVSSATIMGDGSVALILDVEQIVDITEKAKA